MSGYARIAIITGATSGIGEATARKFIAAGFGVIGNGRNAAKLGELESELGPAFRGVAGDAASSAVVDQLFAASIKHFGKPASIAVANAGRGLGGSVKDADLSQFEEMLRTNVTAVTFLLQRAAGIGSPPAGRLPPLSRRHRGHRLRRGTAHIAVRRGL